MTNQEIIDAVVAIVDEMRSTHVPRDTGNMAYNALKVEHISNKLIIKVDDKIAPYFVYTTEPWLSPKWHGKRNPNEGWWHNFANEFLQRLAQRLKGEIV